MSKFSYEFSEEVISLTCSCDLVNTFSFNQLNAWFVTMLYLNYSTKDEKIAAHIQKELNLYNCIQIQHELTYHLLGQELWETIFTKAYTNCEACTSPEKVWKHTCLLLWNETQLRDGWTQFFLDKYFENSLSEFQWKSLIDMYPQTTVYINLNIMNNCYWKTRCRKQELCSNVMTHIKAISIGYGNDFLIGRLCKLA